MFRDARSAYRERKAEIVAGRQWELEEKRVRHLKLQAADDDRSATSSRKSSGSKHSRRPTMTRHDSGNSVKSSTIPSPTSPQSPRSQHQFDQGRSTTLPGVPRPRRRHTDHEGEEIALPPKPRRTMSSPSNIDMDLAYGELPPPLPVTLVNEEVELKGLVGKVKMLLDEADCVQFSVTAMIASLQKNPDAMAAVALTLAEISNIAAKMAPGTLAALKGSAPAVFALLASPQFLIAAGVGVGVTIVALGGFKIIKKIKAREIDQDPGVDEMLEVSGDMSRIETWRQGIADIEEESVGTSVDGEFITPQAAALSQIDLNEKRAKSPRRKHKSSKSSSRSEDTSSKKSGSSKSSKSPKPRKEKKEKKPTPLRLLFT